MNLFRRQPAVDPRTAARRLQELSCLSDRERMKSRARMIREDMGLEPDPRLEPRCGKRS